MAAFSAFSKTKDLGVAGLRLTGELPDIARLYQQNYQADSYVNMLDRKARHERRDEVAASLGDILNKTVKRELNR